MAGRYAVYFVPSQASEFYRLGVNLLGRSVFPGDKIQVKKFSSLPGKYWESLSASPRFYGFHATIKAPFELNGTREELWAALAALAARTSAFKLPKFKISFVDGKFLALTLKNPCPELAALEKNCLSSLSRLTVPLNQEDINRRGELSPHLIDNLKKWGYHLVLDDFKFHMTLTGPVHAKSTAAILVRLLAGYFKSILAQENIFDALTLLYQEDREKPFKALDVFPLNGE